MTATDPSTPPKPHPAAQAVAGFGSRAIETIEHIGALWHLLVEAMSWILMRCTSRKARLGRVAIVSQLVRVGVQSVFIVSLVSGAVGIILSLQMEPPLDNLGQRELIPNIVGVSILRELGPLLAAIVMVGFAGAAIAAEIGTMVVNEEIEALEAHALNPVRFLVVPRVIATVVSVGCLSVIANIVSIGLSAIMCKAAFGIGYSVYFSNLQGQVGPQDFVTGIIKALVYGMLIGLIACGNGLKTSGGAAGVGNATTSTVVESIVAVVLASLLFTVLFYTLGWV